MSGADDCNSLAACVASILELDISDVPNFCAGQKDGGWVYRLSDWLAEDGMCAVHVPFVDRDRLGLAVLMRESDLAFVSEWMRARRIGFAIVRGYTARRVVHATVWFDGELVHDPYPNPSPLINVVDALVISQRDPCEGRQRTAHT